MTHFIFRPVQSLEVSGLGTATLLEAVGTAQNMKGEKMFDKMSARCTALSVDFTTPIRCQPLTFPAGPRYITLSRTQSTCRTIGRKDFPYACGKIILQLTIRFQCIQILCHRLDYVVV